MKTFKRISNGVRVQAFEFTGNSEDTPETERKHIFDKIEDDCKLFFTEHPNKTITILPGCMLVKRASGYLYPFSKADFEAEYEEVLEAVEDV